MIVITSHHISLQGDQGEDPGTVTGDYWPGSESHGRSAPAPASAELPLAHWPPQDMELIRQRSEAITGPRR